MNINELMKLKEEVKSMTEEERRQRVVKIENKMESTSIVDKDDEEYVILTNGLWDLDNMNVALNNVRTKDEIYSMVDTKGALQEIEALAEENTIVLWNESYTDQDFTMTDPGIVVSKDFYEKASKKLRARQKDNKGVSSDDLSNIELTKDDCLDDIVVIHYSCAVKDAENDYEEVDFSKLSTRLVRFNEFYKGIMDLGYNFHYFSEPESITFNDYLDVVNNPDSSYFDFSIEDPKYYEQAKKQH